MRGAPGEVKGNGVQEVREAAHHMQTSAGDEDKEEEEEEVVEWKKRM